MSVTPKLTVPLPEFDGRPGSNFAEWHTQVDYILNAQKVAEGDRLAWVLCALNAHSTACLFEKR